MRRSAVALHVSIVLCIFVLASCGAREAAEMPRQVNATGMLSSVELSLVRRGTHSLLSESGERYFLESKTKNLQPFEGHRVTVSGRVEQNVYTTDDPVIVVTSITSLDESVDTHEWSIPALGITLTAPSLWKAKLSGYSAKFSRIGSHPILTISQKDAEALPQGGEKMIVAGRNSVRISRANGIEEVTILDQSRIISLLFDREAFESDESASAQIQSVLSSIVFHERNASSESTTRVTGSGSGMPCGGSAGILCAHGYFCEVSDRQTGVGKCAKNE